MRNLKVFNFISLDGFFEGPERDISWHPVDVEQTEYAIEMLKQCDMLLFGRITYQLMVSYWPTIDALQNNTLLAQGMNRTTKTVFSRTLSSAEWHNSHLVNEDIEGEVRRLKQMAGQNITILGSGSIINQLAEAGLIDEYQFMLTPLVLGRGTTLFKDISHSFKLKLVESRPFRNGCVLLVYHNHGASF